MGSSNCGPGYYFDEDFGGCLRDGTVYIPPPPPDPPPPVTPSDPAIYGPVNGQFVTLSAWQAWQAAEYARNQQAAYDAYQQQLKNGTVTGPNPYSPPPPPPPPKPTLPGEIGTGTGGSHTSTPHYIDPITGINYGGGGGFEPGSYCDVFGDDPLCDLWGGGGGIVIGGGGGTTIEQPIIIQEGLNATDVAGIVDSGLNTVWNAVVSEVDAALAFLVSGLQAALTAIGNALKAAWAILCRLSGFILNFLQNLLRNLINGILQVLQDIRNALKELYDKILVPLVKALGSLRERLLDLYKKFIRPLLIVLQDIRRVLGILVAFHVPFAAKLDAKIAGIERRLTQPLFYLLGFVNSVANWMNLIVTARYLLQKPLFLNSLNAYVGESLNLQLGAMIHHPTQAQINQANQNSTLPTTSASESAFTVYVDSASGPNAALAAQHTAELERTLGLAV